MDKNYIYLFLLIIILFIPTFLRPDNSPVAGADSYYFLNQIFDKTNYDELTTPISNFIFHIMPTDLFLIKLIMLIISICCVYIFYNTLKISYSRNTSFFGAFMLISTVYFSKVLFLLEDDLFGLLFLLVSLFYIEKFNKSKRNIGHTITETTIYLLLSIIYCVLATSIWKFCIFYFLLFLILTNFNKLYLIICIAIIPFSIKLINFIIPNVMVSENRVGIIGIFTALCFMGLYINFKEMREDLKIPIIIFSALFILNSKMMFVIIPIMIIAVCGIYESNKYIRNSFIIIQIILFIGTINYSVFDFPNNSDYQVLKFCKEQELNYNTTLEVEWGAGYYAQYNGIDSNYFGHYQEQDYRKKLYYSTSRNAKGCETLKKGSKTTCYYCS